MKDRHYLAIDLKSFYASVECVERGLDPMQARLVVADPERTEKTICLAVSPALKALGIKNRCRVFQIPKNIDYIMAPPRMQRYIDYAAEVYGVYLRYMAPEDIYVYSIDEAFLDVTDYLTLYGKTPREMAVMLMNAVKEQVGVRAACGIGTNLYLAKIALDITAKHAADYIGELTEERFRETLWDHQPLTDFWRIGPGIRARLGRMGIFTMGQLARMDEELLYYQFGRDAELLIDHAWGRETVTMADIKAYRPRTSSITQGQVLMEDYSFEDGELIIKEMTEQLCLDLVRRGMVTGSVTLMVGYSRDHGPERFSSKTAAAGSAGQPRKHGGDLRQAASFRQAQAMEEPQPIAPSRQAYAAFMGSTVSGTASLEQETASDRLWMAETAALYRQIVDPRCGIRRVCINANNIKPYTGEEQLSLFGSGINTAANGGSGAVKKGDHAFHVNCDDREKERRLQETLLEVKRRYGKNAALRGMDHKEKAMTIKRNGQIGGHKSGKETDGPNGRV